MGPADEVKVEDKRTGASTATARAPTPAPAAGPVARARRLWDRARTRVEIGGARLVAEPIASWLFLVAVRLWYEAQGVYNVDTPIYWTVGRAILKGYTPWRDLYETKPPGIFLLSALSYLLTGGGVLTNVTQVLSLTFVAIAPLFLLRRMPRAGADRLAAAPVFVSLWAIALAVTAYSADHAAEVQVEAHGLAGMVAYALLIGAPGRWGFRGRAIAIAIAIGMKEPFLLLVPGVYLVIDPRTERPGSDFWGPLIAAGVAGTLFLLVVGWLPAFLFTYLPSMVGGHIHLYGEPLPRALVGLNLTWDDMRKYATMLPNALIFCAGVYVISRDRTEQETGTPLTARRFQAVFVGTMLAGLAIGMGGTFYDHHMVMASPLLLAVLFALIVRSLDRDGLRLWVRPLLIAMAILGTNIYATPIDALIERARRIKQDDKLARESALVIDGVLDRLHVNRYLYLGPGGFVPYPFTRHVPLGPLFFQQVAFFEGRYPWFVDQFRKRLAEAKVVVVAMHMTGPLDAEVKAKLQTEFQPAPPQLIPAGKHCQYPILIRKGVPIPP